MQRRQQKKIGKIEHQHPTCGIFYCRDSAEINGCGSLQTSSWLDSDVLRIRQQKHTAIRCASFEKTHSQTISELRLNEHSL
jgi:hypothetical protein